MWENSRQGAGSGNLACIGYLQRAPDGWLGGLTLAVHRALCITTRLCQHVSALPRKDLLSDPPCWDCHQSCQVSLRQNPLTYPVYWRSLSAVRCSVISDPGWTLFLWLLAKAEIALPLYQMQQMSSCMLSVDVTVSFQTNFGFVSLGAIAFVLHNFFVMPFLKIIFSSIYQSFPLFPKLDQVGKLI